MIRLEYFEPQDFQLLIDWVSDRDLLMNWAGTQFRFPLTMDKLTWYIRNSNDFEKSSTLIYKAFDTESGQTVGHVSLTAINRTNRSARITRVLVDKSKRGKGIGEQITRAILHIGFENLNLHRMSLGVFDFNHPAINIYKKCGFHIDGILRDINKHGDGYWSLMEMSILENEWHETNLVSQSLNYNPN